MDKQKIDSKPPTLPLFANGVQFLYQFQTNAMNRFILTTNKSFIIIFQFTSNIDWFRLGNNVG